MSLYQTQGVACSNSSTHFAPFFKYAGIVVVAGGSVPLCWTTCTGAGAGAAESTEMAMSLPDVTIRTL